MTVRRKAEPRPGTRSLTQIELVAKRLLPNHHYRRLGAGVSRGPIFTLLLMQPPCPELHADGFAVLSYPSKGITKRVPWDYWTAFATRIEEVDREGRRVESTAD